MSEQPPAQYRSAGREDKAGGWNLGLVCVAALVMFLAGRCPTLRCPGGGPGYMPYAFTSGNQLFDSSLT